MCDNSPDLESFVCYQVWSPTQLGRLIQFELGYFGFRAADLLFLTDVCLG
jgi:hypothetical protein